MRPLSFKSDERLELNRGGLSRKPLHWLQLLVGLSLLVGFIVWMGRDGVPQGPSQELYRHALRSGMDSTALFYSEVDEMPYYESTVTPWRQAE